MKFQGDILNFCDFIQVFVFTTNHHLNVTLSKNITICSIYLPPSDVLSKNSQVNLIDQLPQPFMLVGDFNMVTVKSGVARTQMTEEKL